MCGKLTCPSSYREFIKKLCSIAFCNHINNKYEPESYLCHSHYIVTLCILIHTPKHCHTTSLSPSTHGSCSQLRRHIHAQFTIFLSVYAHVILFANPINLINTNQAINTKFKTIKYQLWDCTIGIVFACVLA